MGAPVKSKSFKKVNLLLAMALIGNGAYASTADQELLDILLKNGSINKSQYNSMLGKDGLASSQLLDILSKNGTITKDQYANLTTKNPSLAPTPVAPVATLNLKGKPNPDGTHITFGKTGGIEVYSNVKVKEKDKDGNLVDKLDPNGIPVEAKGADDKPIKDFSFKLGGRVQIDSQVNWNQNGPYGTDLADGVGFRRARLYTEGVMFRDYEYRFEYDFARNNGGTQGITDAFVKYIHFAPFSVIIGQQNEGKSMESVMSNNNLTFIERSLPNNAFFEQGANSKYQLGAKADYYSKIWELPYTFNGGITTESVGAPGPGNSSGNSQGTTNAAGGTNANGTNINRNAFSGNTSYQVVGRTTFAPIYDKGNSLLHTGVWGSWRSVNNNFNADGTVRTGGWAYQSQPDTDVDRTNWVNTGNLTSAQTCVVVIKGQPCRLVTTKAANNIAMFGAELAGTLGPAHFGAEYSQAQIAGPGYSGSDTLQGFYTYAGVFLTGENRPYDYKKGTWDRLIPNHNFLDGDGWGAFEIAGRYDLIDMNTKHINGGSMDAGTLAFNWYLSPRVRFMTNWVHVFAVNNNNALRAAGGKCAFPGQGSNAAIGCFSGLSPNVWEMAVRFDY